MSEDVFIPVVLVAFGSVIANLLVLWIVIKLYTELYKMQLIDRRPGAAKGAASGS